MSKKFEQLLDYLVNEEHEKFDKLFHDIVVEKSREIYENLISEEEDEEMDESRHEDEEMDEGYYDEDEDESMMEIGGDATDKFVSDVEDEDAMMGSDDDMDDMDDMDMSSDDDTSDDMSMMGDEESSPEIRDEIDDLRDDFEDLKLDFEELMAKVGEDDEEVEIDDEEDMEPDMSSEEDEEDEEESNESMYKMESRKITREYREKVSDGHGAEKKGKGEEGGINTKSAVSSAKGRPTTDANASNILRADHGEDKKPGVGGVLKKGGEFVKSGTQNVGGTKAKGYSDRVSAKHSESGVNDKSILGRQ